MKKRFFSFSTVSLDLLLARIICATLLEMKRERKNQLGTSNLSARGGGDSVSLPSNSSTLATSASLASLTNKLSETKEPREKSREREREKGGSSPPVSRGPRKPVHDPLSLSLPQEGPGESKGKTATWKPAPIHQRDFLTTHSQSFTDPLTRENCGPASPKSTLQIAEEAIQSREEKAAVDDLCKLIRTSYGTVGAMLRTVRQTLPPSTLATRPA